jgi:hypothetical protein
VQASSADKTRRLSPASSPFGLPLPRFAFGFMQPLQPLPASRRPISLEPLSRRAEETPLVGARWAPFNQGEGLPPSSGLPDVRQLVQASHSSPTEPLGMQVGSSGAAKQLYALASVKYYQSVKKDDYGIIFINLSAAIPTFVFFKDPDGTEIELIFNGIKIANEKYEVKEIGDTIICKIVKFHKFTGYDADLSNTKKLKLQHNLSHYKNIKFKKVHLIL